jgi:prepilin-type N-terminal cleavage/methylation domain-containing protein
MSGICRARVRQIPRGFTLIEMAVAILVLALLLGTILVPLQTQVDSRKVDETQRILEQAREALLGYASAYGYFPCPASPTSNGQESGPNHATGACTGVTGTNVYHGLLPAATLGLAPTDAQGYLLDGWGLSPQNRIRYAVFRDVLTSSLFVRAGGMRTATMATIAGMSLIHVCNSGAGATSTACGAGTVTLTSNAPVAIWSSGPNAPTGGTSTDEAQNPNWNGGSADRIFVMRTRSGAAGAEFDDIVTWISPSTMFSRLIAAGQLP